MLEIAGLAKSFEGRAVLDGVDLCVEAGEGVALLGGNGSGKTTTLRAIVGLTAPDRGRVRVAGIDVVACPREARRLLSYLPQKALFPSTLTVREVLGVAARLRYVPDSRVEEELDRCDLMSHAERFVATLSGGERQRLGLAVAFLPDVPLFLFDEPTANLDVRALEIFFRRASGLVADGRSVLFTTHVSADVDSLATRVARLQDGVIVSPSTEAGARSVSAIFRATTHVATPRICAEIIAQGGVA